MTVHDRISSDGKFQSAAGGRSGNLVTVNFRQDTLFAVERDDGVFVAVKPMCDSLGLNWSGQLQRLREDPVLSEGMRVIHIPSPGGAQETTCLKLELVNGWLFKVDSRRVKDDETRRKLLTYQRECYAVLFDAFYGKRQPKQEIPEVDETSESESLKLRHVTECRHTFGAQAVAELWMRLDLPVVPSMLRRSAQMTFWDYRAVKSVEGESAA